MRLRILMALGLAALAFTGLDASAEATKASPKITLLVTSTPLQAVLEQACASAGMKCSIPVDVKLPSQKISTNYRNQSLDEVLDGVLRLVPTPGLVYSIKNDTVLFEQRKVSMAQVELPVNGVFGADPMVTGGPVRLRITSLEFHPPDQVELQYQATWSNGIAFDFQSLHNSLRPRLKLRSGKIIPIGGGMKGEPLPNDQPEKPAGTRAWTFQLQGPADGKIANDPPVALVWNLAWWPR